MCHDSCRTSLWTSLLVSPSFSSSVSNSSMNHRLLSLRLLLARRSGIHIGTVLHVVVPTRAVFERFVFSARAHSQRHITSECHQCECSGGSISACVAEWSSTRAMCPFTLFCSRTRRLLTCAIYLRQSKLPTCFSGECHILQLNRALIILCF